MVKKPTKSSKNQTKLDKTYIVIRSHKLIVFLLLLMMIFPASFAYEKYKDWDNAQMIKGLSRDFPELVEQIEKATGLELEVESNCMTTTEKFSNGVKTCEFLIAKISNEDQVKKSFDVVEKSNRFIKSEEFENKEGFHFYYRNKKSCSIANTESIYVSCIVPVRDANLGLRENPNNLQ